MLPFSNQLQDNVLIGALEARGLDSTAHNPLLEERLARLLDDRSTPLKPDEDAFRKACRDMMRIGTYKPTGRGKPASEYLLRAASDNSFPRINTAADINNYISLSYLVPISLWDTDKVAADSWIFRPGMEGEQFVFNPSGQSIDLKDLISGFAVSNGKETPIVSPVKDCQQTKTDNDTRNIAAAVYYPSKWGGKPALTDIMQEFAEIMKIVSDQVDYALI